MTAEAKVNTNLKTLTPSRKKLRPGDIFVMQVRPNEYIFGRVIRTDASVFAPGGVLIYIYSAFSNDKKATPVLDKNDLLVPPLVINRLPWSRGYFETVAHVPLKDEDLLPVHCLYRHWDGEYYDEYRNKLAHRTEPCGEFGLYSYRTVDDTVSKALGIPLAPN